MQKTYLILVDEDGVGASIPGQMPQVLRICRIVAEENGDATSHKAIEDSLARGTVAGGLQTEDGAKKQTRDVLRILRAADFAAIQESAILRFHALMQQRPTQLAVELDLARRSSERYQIVATRFCHHLLPCLHIRVCLWVETGRVGNPDHLCVGCIGIALDQELGHVAELWVTEHGDAPLVGRILAQEIPYHASQHQHVICSLSPSPLRLRQQPAHEFQAQLVPHLHQRIEQVARNVESHVVGKIQSGS